MLNLLKKDFLITKKISTIIIILAVIIPIFISFFSDGQVIPSFLIILMVSNLLGMMLLSNIYEVEEKYSKALALITTIGYSRKIQIIEKYLLVILMFLYCFIVYLIESFFIKELGNVSIQDFTFSFFCFALVSSIYLSLTIKYGLKFGRYIVMLIILLISLGPAIFSNLNISIDLSFFQNINKTIFVLILFIMTIVIYGISYKISLSAYMKKEL